jgi:hypothetical protein
MSTPLNDRNGFSCYQCGEWINGPIHHCPTVPYNPDPLPVPIYPLFPPQENYVPLRQCSKCGRYEIYCRCKFFSAGPEYTTSTNTTWEFHEENEE